MQIVSVLWQKLEDAALCLVYVSVVVGQIVSQWALLYLHHQPIILWERKREIFRAKNEQIDIFLFALLSLAHSEYIAATFCAHP